MIPVASLQDVRIHWLEVRQQGFVLHGFLLCTSSDQFIPEYISDEGLTDLDVWSGEKCGIFLLYDPPVDWIEYARANNHVWWRTFGENASDLLTSKLADSRVLHVGADQPIKPRELLSPAANRGLAKRQVASVLAEFELQPTEHPSMVLFRDLQDHEFWVVSFDDFLGLPITELRTAFKQWFADPEFRRLLKG